jgi:branched-chain amino acid transport system ATP-binding protein
MLQVTDLRVGYGRVTVLRGVTLTVPEHGFTALTGPNGHGKTTLLRAISGLLTPSAGSVEFGGQRIDGSSPTKVVARGIAHIPQGDLLFADMTVLENLLMGSFPRAAWRRRKERLDEVFTLFPKLAERRQQRCRTLSGGERRMVGVGRGLMSGAKLLMVDEPALGLAPLLAEEVYDALSGIAQSGRSVLVVDESLSHLSGHAETIYLLERGQVVRGGSPAELVDDRGLASAYLGG